MSEAALVITEVRHAPHGFRFRGGERFARYHDCALSEPVRVMMDGRETVYIVSANVYRDMKRAQREVLASVDLTDNDLALIEVSEIPVKYRLPENE